ncbi:GcrA family cell cycle regulator [Consotaella salsifontis]|uniref:Global cell cycle regulator GcrA n=1 Tax=Consotaella salsifontis TaxID=1365950 RepID=A0A1T4MKP3_9HYPH|nr:GcrA family cell cycle regulator [Consotaella salsifontis]SJZ67427.1 Global cell cycle regulator GcrA [Consotaella salsifontis]
MSWTDERVELLKQLWNEGLSASQIAGQLGGVSRNAVIGKVHRLKLEGRAKTALPGQAEAPVQKAVEAVIETRAVEVEISGRAAAQMGGGRSVVRSVGATALKVETETDLVVQHVEGPGGEVVPISRNLTLVQLTERTCKWPLGDPLSEDFRFCGNPSGDSSPYCTYHARLAFQPPSERRRVR